MKKLIFLFIVFNISLFSQEVDKSKMFSNSHLGFLGGINFSTLTGSSIIIEGKTNLSSKLNLKLSVGYSTINKKEGYNVKTYRFINREGFPHYEILSYKVNELNYDVFPISFGLEYFFFQGNFLPYCSFEFGYNFYSFHIKESNHLTSGWTNTYDELPDEHKNLPPIISEEDSYRIAVGIGFHYKLSPVINLDIRYLYQFNTNILDTNQILAGINFDI